MSIMMSFLFFLMGITLFLFTVKITLKWKKVSNLACMLICHCQGIWKNKNEKEDKINCLINLGVVIRTVTFYNKLSLSFYYFLLIEN